MWNIDIKENSCETTKRIHKAGADLSVVHIVFLWTPIIAISHNFDLVENVCFAIKTNKIVKHRLNVIWLSRN